MELIFSFAQEIRNEEVFLAVQIAEKGSSRFVYLDDLRALKNEAPKLSSLLIQEQCRSLRISPLSSQAGTVHCNRVLVREENALEVVKQLILAKKILWKGRGLFFHPLLKPKLLYHAERDLQGGLELSGFCRIEGKEYPLQSLDFIFPSSPVWGIHEQCVFTFPEDVSWKAIQKVYPKPQRVEGKKKQDFVELYREEPPVGVAEIIWKGEEEKERVILPFLQLHDSHGAFAELWLDYGEGTTVAYHDLRTWSGRDMATEKFWEKDLLETDFIRKSVGVSHYYCPLDKVAKSLAFLLEMGWKVFDRQGRQIYKMTGKELSMSSAEERVAIYGKVQYEQFSADLSSILGAFNRRDKFVELSSGAVGLLDGSLEIEELEGAEIIGGKAYLRKQQCGVLGDAWQRICDEPMARWLGRLQGGTALEEAPPSVDFQGSLYPYQQAGVDWLYFLYQMGASGLLADEMGLGKTVQLLAFFSKIYGKGPLLLVVPTSLIFNWRREWEKFLPGKALYVHEGALRAKESDRLQEAGAVLTSYACLRIDQMLFFKTRFSCIVLDEAQTIKNSDSQIARTVYQMQADMRVCLTGTPIENRAEDLWSLFHFLEPSLLGDKKEFQALLFAGESDSRYRQRIKKKIKPFILKRAKQQVAQDLPEKIEQDVWVEMEEEQRGFYEGWLAKTKKGLLQKVHEGGISSHRMEILEAILRLRQICCHPVLVDGEYIASSAKLDRLMTDMEEVVGQGKKVLVYSQFTKMLGLIAAEIQSKGWEHVYLDGSTENRESVVFRFQNDPKVSIFLISLKAGGVGLNLTAADYVFLFDPWWNESAERQAIDRAHRLGRKEPVVARRYVAAESIEAKIMKLKEHKLHLAQGLLDIEEGTGPLSLSEWLDLI